MTAKYVQSPQQIEQAAETRQKSKGTQSKKKEVNGCGDKFCLAYAVVPDKPFVTKYT